MSTNLIEECARRWLGREEMVYGEVSDFQRQNAREFVAPVVADVLDILSAEGRIASAIEPGPCWADSGVDWPDGSRPRCELRAGHAGAHECDRGSVGGSAVWIDAPTPAPDAPDNAGGVA